MIQIIKCLFLGLVNTTLVRTSYTVGYYVYTKKKLDLTGLIMDRFHRVFIECSVVFSGVFLFIVD